MLACMAMHPTVHEMREVSRYTMGPNNVLVKMRKVQSADIGWPTGNGKNLSNSEACCLAQLCLGAA